MLIVYPLDLLLWRAMVLQLANIQSVWKAQKGEKVMLGGGFELATIHCMTYAWVLTEICWANTFMGFCGNGYQRHTALCTSLEVYPVYNFYNFFPHFKLIVFQVGSYQNNSRFFKINISQIATYFAITCIIDIWLLIGIGNGITRKT